jgi:hypothetical protein
MKIRMISSSKMITPNVKEYVRKERFTFISEFKVTEVTTFLPSNFFVLTSV